MELYLVRNGPRLAPAHDEDLAKAFKIKPGQVVKATVKLVRNYRHHRKFMALVEYVAEHHPVFNTRDKALTAIKLAVGHCDFFPHPQTGELVPIPKSISFDKMDQGEFDAFYEEAVRAVLRDLTNGVSEDELDAFVEAVARF